MSYNKIWYENNKFKVSKQRKNNKTVNQPISCLYCNMIIGSKGFSKHLYNLHNIKWKDYIKEHWKELQHYGWKLCDGCKIEPVKCCLKNTRRKWTTCSLKCSNKIKSKYFKNRIPWNKGISATPETREKLSNKLKERIKLGIWKNPSSTKRARIKISKAAKQRVVNGTWINPAAKKSMTAPEKLAAKILTESNIKFYGQFCITTDKKTFLYDFKIKNKPIIIEIDGDYWHGGPARINNLNPLLNKVKRNDELKNQAAIKRGYTLIRIWESELKKNPNVLIQKLDGIQK